MLSEDERRTILNELPLPYLELAELFARLFQNFEDSLQSGAVIHIFQEKYQNIPNNLVCVA